MDITIEAIRECVARGNYFVKSHAVIHASKEGFDDLHMAEAVLGGKIIEDYPTERRVLVCGLAALTENVTVYLHVVCEYSDPGFVDFVTAYIPDDAQWQVPPFSRRRKHRR